MALTLMYAVLEPAQRGGVRLRSGRHRRPVQLPFYVPDLNQVEGVWSLLRRGPLANTAFTDDEHLERTLRRGRGTFSSGWCPTEDTVGEFGGVRPMTLRRRNDGWNGVGARA
jgi:hypothetical protein